MFEKEAEEWRNSLPYGIDNDTFYNIAIPCMEFGYNKAKEDARLKLKDKGIIQPLKSSILRNERLSSQEQQELCAWIECAMDFGENLDECAKELEEANKANEWHYPSNGEYPKVNQECYFIHSNTYGEGNKPIFTKSSIQVHAGIYTYALDEEGNETTDLCFYDDFIEEEMDINEVYAWKEIVLPELKENE